MYAVILSPITNDSSPETVERYGEVIDMDTVFDEGFTRDFCDGQTSPLPPRWADDESGVLYTYSEGAARSFSGILREDLAARVSAGVLQQAPTWLTAGKTVTSAIVTAEVLSTVEAGIVAEGITQSQITTAINTAIAEGFTTEAEIIEWIKQNRNWYA